MPVLSNRQYAGGGFGNEAKVVRVQYDFASDAGAQGDYEILEASKACVVELVYMDCKAAGASGGSMTMDLGKEAGGQEFFAAKAVAALTLDSLHKADAAAAVELAAGEKIVHSIDVADLTAGKFEFVFKVYAR